jgi:chromatin segregation and condensation protein Rec8/ScpA/Scc1 (kleisin family)
VLVFVFIFLLVCCKEGITDMEQENSFSTISVCRIVNVFKNNKEKVGMKDEISTE